MFSRSTLRRVALVALHAAVIMIAAGALVTYLTARYGTIHLRAGGGYAHTWRGPDSEVLPLPFGLRLQAAAPLDSIASAALVADTGSGQAAAAVALNKAARVGGYTFIPRYADADRGGLWLYVAHDAYGEPLVYLAFVILLLSMLVLAPRAGRRRNTMPAPARAAALFSGGMCLAVLFFRSLVLGNYPGASVPDTLLTVALTAFVVAFFSGRTIGLVSLASGLAALCAALSSGGAGHPIPVLLDHPLLGLHVSLAMISYALFAVLAVCGVVALVAPRRVLSPRFVASERRLLYYGMVALAAAIATGSLWASQSWGRYWSWDPKETCALITLAVYLLPVHRRSLRVFRRPAAMQLFLVLAFMAVLFTWFGVNYFLGGRHAYI